MIVYRWENKKRNQINKRMLHYENNLMIILFYMWLLRISNKILLGFYFFVKGLQNKINYYKLNSDN